MGEYMIIRDSSVYYGKQLLQNSLDCQNGYIVFDLYLNVVFENYIFPVLKLRWWVECESWGRAWSGGLLILAEERSLTRQRCAGDDFRWWRNLQRRSGRSDPLNLYSGIICGQSQAFPALA